MKPILVLSMCVCFGVCAALSGGTARIAAADEVPAAPSASAGFDLEEVQGILAMQRLDGWLLTDFEGQNPIAEEIVRPSGLATRRWFYFVPARGEPTAIVAKVEAQSFTRVRGGKIEYSGWRELDTALKAMLKGRKRIAMEYSAQSAIPELSRVDAGTVEKVKSFGVEIVSSAELVQAAKARWGKDGRAQHYVAVHHLTVLKDDALEHIRKELAAGRKVTEYDVQQRLVRGLAVRGLISESPPIVAAGPNTANPRYLPTAEGSRAIAAGDLVLVEVWARAADDPRAIYADLTWVAYVGDRLPKALADDFALVVRARDAAVSFIEGRLKAGKPVKGFEVDKAARDVIGKAGHGDRFIHRTGHSIDTRPHGDGANLDDFETHDVRTLIQGTGFTIEPGLYTEGEHGVRSAIDCYVGGNTLEITTPVQKEITLIELR